MAAQAGTIDRLQPLGRVRASEPRLVTIEAPAGYGKSELAEQIAQLDDGAVHFDLSAATDVGVLAAQLYALVGGESGGFDPAGADTASVGRAVAAAWARSPRAPRTLVFDNAESLADSADAMALVRAFLSPRIDGRRAVVCSRVPLSVNVGRFAYPHESLHLGADELRFSALETAEIFRDSRLDDVAVARVARYSGGWPTVVLFLRHLHINGSLAPLMAGYKLADADQLYLYLGREAFSRLSDRAVETLAAACVLPEATAGELETFLQFPIEAYLPQLSPFLEWTANGKLDVYPVVREAVTRVNEIDMQRVRSAAAEAALQRGGSLRAARLFMEAGAFERAAQALDTTESLAFAEAPLDVMEVLEQLPATALRSNPRLWTYAMSVRAFAVSPAAWLEEGLAIWRSLKRDTSVRDRAGVAGNIVNALISLGRFDECDIFLDEFEALLGLDENDIGRGTLDIWRTTLQVVRGQLSDLDTLDLTFAPLRRNPGWAAIYTCEIQARVHRVLGRHDEERQASRRAVEMALASKMPVPIAVCTLDAAWGAWAAGDDDLYARYLGILEAESRPSTLKAVRHFIECARGRAATAVHDFERLSARIYAYIIAASGETDSERRVHYARCAVAAADEAARPYMRVVSRVALALCERPRFAQHVREAIDIASDLQAPIIGQSLKGLLGGGDAGTFAALQQRFERRRRPRRLIVRIVDDTVELDGKQFSLPAKARELLTALALERRPVHRDTLVGRIWPDADEKAAYGNLKTQMSQIRRLLNDREAIVYKDQAYLLAAHVAVDLEAAESLLQRADFTDRFIALARDLFERLCRRPEYRAQQWEWFAQTELRLAALERSAGMTLIGAFLKRGQLTSALHVARDLAARDPYDEAAREEVVTILVSLERPAEAAVEVRDYEAAVRRELGVVEPSDLRRHLATARRSFPLSG